MLNIEKYKKDIAYIIQASVYEPCIYSALIDFAEEKSHKVMETTKELLDWFCEEYDEPTLTDVERDYLSAIMKPFLKKDLEIYVTKFEATDFNSKENVEFLEICIDEEAFSLPNFKPNTMYKGMKEGKPYYANELGITK